MTAAVEHFAKMNRPIKKLGLRQLGAHVLKTSRPLQLGCSTQTLSKTSMCNLIERNLTLSIRLVRAIESRLIQAVTRRNVGEHIARMQAAMDRYNVHDARRIFNIDESGVSFRTMAGKRLRKGITTRDKQYAFSSLVRTKGSLDRVTVLCVVNAAGERFKPAIVFPGKQPHYRRVDGVVETIHSYIPTCYFYQCDSAGVDSSVFYDWATNFVEETAYLREGRKNMILVLYGYGCHVQYKVLQYLKENGVYVIGLPAHTSHVLQPLDVTVFGPFNSYIQKEVHSRAMRTQVLDAFDVADVLKFALSDAVTASNVVSGFKKCGIWDLQSRGTCIEELEGLHFFEENTTVGQQNAQELSIEVLIESFRNCSRRLLRDVDVGDSGTVRISTNSGAYLTADAVFEALLARDKRREMRLEVPEGLLDVRDTPAEIRGLLEIRLERIVRRSLLNGSREHRRIRARQRAQRGSTTPSQHSVHRATELEV